MLEWDSEDIDWNGATGERGLRGVALDGEIVYMAAGAELLALTPDLKILDSWRCPYLMHCHGIAVWERRLYVTSAAFDSILCFDLERKAFAWAMHVQRQGHRFGMARFDPRADDGPLPLDKLHLNSVHCNRHGMYITGLRTGGMLHFNGGRINMAVELPANSRDARPFRAGVLFNDTDAGALRYTGRGEGEEDRAMRPPHDTDTLMHAEAVEEGLARVSFTRGLCVLSERIVAGGSSPATVTLYDLADNCTLGSIIMSRDAREAIHTIADWPFQGPIRV